MAKRKKVRNDVVQVFHGQGVFPFFNLSAEIRNMIYALLFVSEFYVGESANKNNQWVFVNFAREYRRVREFELSMVNKQFFQESTTVFFSRNGFELASFKSLDLFLSHIGPIASSSIRSLRIFPKLDDPTPALCHLVVATNLQHLDVEMNLRRVRTGAWKIKLENAMDIVFNQDDKVVFSFTRTSPPIPCSFLMLEPEPSMAEILNIRGILYSKLPGRFYYALTDFITKKKNGKYNARRIKYSSDPSHMYKHVMDGTLKNYGWKRKGVKHYEDVFTKALRHKNWSPETCDCYACIQRRGAAADKQPLAEEIDPTLTSPFPDG